MATPASALPADLEREVIRLKKERNAVILAHYYQDSDIQDVADFLGDSLQLAQAARSTKADVICFAGVHFMAETAKILNPDRVVVIPDMEAGCSLADGCPVDRYRAWRAKYPGAVGVTYINCSAAVKAESDYICTSSNAEKIVRAIPEDKTILFAPDRNLGRHIERVTGRKMVLWGGSCLVHETFSERKIIGLLERHPGAELIAHPECEEALLRHATFIGSTTALLKHAIASPKKTFIVATEPGILHQMKKGAPDKEFIPAPPQNERCSCNECPHMKRNTLEKVYLALRDLSPRIEMTESLRERARVPIDRMLALSLPPRARPVSPPSTELGGGEAACVLVSSLALDLEGPSSVDQEGFSLDGSRSRARRRGEHLGGPPICRYSPVLSLCRLALPASSLP